MKSRQHILKPTPVTSMMMMNSLFDKIIHEKNKVPLFAGTDERLVFLNA